jgi:hypothetical protein
MATITGTTAFNTTVRAFLVAPPDAVYVRFDIITYTNGSGGFATLAMRPMIATALPSQTAHPQYTQGPGMGAPGNKTVRVYTRSGAVPSAPSGNVPPAGWSTTIPADDGTPVYASDVETTADGVTAVGPYTTPQLFQATTPVAGTDTKLIDSESGVSASIIRFIPAGGSKTIAARIRTLLASASGTQYLRIEWRVVGGSWATLGSEGENAYGVGEYGVVSKIETFTNNSGADRNYEFRANLRVTGSPAGADPSRSHITA